MRPVRLILLAGALSSVVTAAEDAISGSPIPSCAQWRDSAPDACLQPLDAVTTVVAGSYYVAKLPCLDCPTLEYTGNGPTRKHFITQKENSLLYNISLSRDRHDLLLNSMSITPPLSLRSNGEPPQVYVPQVNPNFSRADLDTSIACVGMPCNDYSGACFCLEPSNSLVSLDYDYAASEMESDETTASWKITFDAIGGQDGYMDDPDWVFNSTAQQMLQITIQGTIDSVHDAEDNEVVQASSTLFGAVEAQPKPRYTFEIVDVQLVGRSYMFTSPHRSLWDRIRFFFGFETRRPDGHIIYREREWSWAKKGTLKNGLLTIWNDWDWTLMIIIVFSILGGVVALYGLYLLAKAIMLQHELASSGGMDEVWRHIRRGRDDDEEEGLLDGQEDDEDPESPHPEFHTPRAKPLPSKPLPEKPLPDVPLLDDA
ncbi:uncharacterized protein BDR25DRAFT_305776 [Lindgomyces ingoldianus]|uniref:Uncharacterized protein n=1 Tax=Lindgomyces ingoldianus TaxID=673940 RepID=A0ACB6QKT1_9PLEO|nr:uncharacterized protein BDR25DRAFT_305776 [Lindgomyces ingoldianus]KAF2466917.1 hypothetical protein BDR25DRAFT_305776 [Lindgomyces ingoldianus]